MTVQSIAKSSAGFRKWCFQNIGSKSARLQGKHYVMFSAAGSWKAVANWYSRTFAMVEDKPSRELGQIVRSLHLKSSGVSGKEKIWSVRRWIGTHLTYKTNMSNAHVPNTFDAVVTNGGGDCKDLTLVAITLLRAGGIVADPALTNATKPISFKQKPADIDINHVVVYVPQYDHLIDPTVSLQSGLTYMSVGQHLLDATSGQILVADAGMTRPYRRTASEPRESQVVQVR